MTRYRFLCDIKFQGKRFKIFSNENFNKTFLQVLDDNSLCYPLLDDYIKLDKIYNIKKSDIVTEIKNLNFKPGAFHKGKYIAAGALSVIIGMLTTTSSTNYDTKYKAITSIIEEQDMTKSSEEEIINDIITTTTTQTTTTQATTTTTEPRNNKTIEKENGTSWLITDNYVIYVKNNDEFRKYVDNPNPTFEDIRKAIENNDKIDEKVRPLLNEYVDGVEKCYPELDLVCFYENIKRLYITYEEEEELAKKGAAAYYDTSFGNVCFNKNKDIDKNVAFHEFTHMFTESQIEKDDKIIYRSASAMTYDEEQDKIIEYGGSYLEAIDELFLYKVFGPESVINRVHIYREFMDIFNYATKLGISITDMQKSNVRYIINELEKKGIKDIRHIIELMDSDEFKSSEIELETDLRIECYALFFENLTKYKLKQNEDKNQIYLYIIELLNDGHIQKNYGYSSYFPEQQLVIENTLELVQNILGIENTISTPQIKIKEEFYYIERTERHYDIKSYAAIKDEDGTIRVYEKNSNIEVNIDTRYGEFASVLIENGILNEGKISAPDFWKYCDKKCITDDNLYLIFSDMYRHYYYVVQDLNGNTRYLNTTTYNDMEPMEGIGEYVNILKEKNILNEDLEINETEFYEYFGKGSTKVVEIEKYKKKREEIKKIEKETEQLLFINTEAPDNPIEIYLAKKDENGKILIYDRYTYNQVNINTNYCEFVSTLKENGFLTLDDATNKVTPLDKNKFLNYCKTKNNENNPDKNYNTEEKITNNEDGSYIVTSTNTKLNTDRYEYYKDSTKIYDNILYYYDINNNLIKIEATIKTTNEDNTTKIDKVIFRPDGSYDQTIELYDIDKNIIESKQTIYDINQQTKTSNNTIKNKSGDYDEIVTIYDYKVTSPYKYDGYITNGDYTYKTVNDEIIIKQENDIIYRYRELDQRNPLTINLLQEAYRVFEEDGIITYRENGKKLEYDNKKGTIIHFKDNEKESIERIKDSEKFVEYYDYDSNLIRTVINNQESNLTFFANNKQYTIGPDESIHFRKDGEISSLYTNNLNNINRVIYKENQIEYITDIYLDLGIPTTTQNDTITIYFNDYGNIYQIYDEQGILITFFKDDSNYFFVNNRKEKNFRIYNNETLLYESNDNTEFKIIEDEQGIQRIELTDGTIIDTNYQQESSFKK